MFVYFNQNFYELDKICKNDHKNMLHRANSYQFRKEIGNELLLLETILIQLLVKVFQCI